MAQANNFATNGLTDMHMMLQVSARTWMYMNLLGYEHNETEDPMLAVPALPTVA